MGRMLEFGAGHGGVEPAHGTPAFIGGSKHAFDSNKGHWVHEDQLSAKTKAKPGDRVQLGEPGSTQLGQVFAAAPGAHQWHAVDTHGNAHIWNEKTGLSTPAPDTGTALANYSHQINAKYGRQGYASWGSHTDVGRSLNVNATDIKQLQASARGKVKKAK